YTSGPPKVYSNGQDVYPAGYAPADAVDYTILNTTAWNWAIDASTLKFVDANAGKTSAQQLPDPIWTQGAPPTSVTVMGCQVRWDIFEGVPGWPVPLAERTCLGNVTELRLVPYGSSKLRMAELPTIDLKKQHGGGGGGGDGGNGHGGHGNGNGNDGLGAWGQGGGWGDWRQWGWGDRHYDPSAQTKGKSGDGHKSRFPGVP
ncbi:hypothetical protein LTS18_001917, partial [Coniosporium uncinatum]